MNRLLSVLVTLFILFLIYLWINHITNPDELAIPESNALVEPQVSTDQDIAPVTSEEDTPEVTEASRETQEEPVIRPTDDTQPAQSPPATAGGHLVIAGNFLERANAEKHLRTVKQLGYDNAEILVFEISEYYTVCAGRYDDLASARKISGQLKEVHGIDCYVRHGN